MNTGRERLTTTSYAVLGLLSLRSWTGYELTQQAQRSLSFCWPKGESVLYEEPRRLVELGLASVHGEHEGGRRRNRYAITADGRAALEDWLQQVTAPPHLQLEPMVRMMFADSAPHEARVRTVRELRHWVTEQRRAGRRVVDDYRAGLDPFPDRRALNVLNAAFYVYLYDAVDRWTHLAEHVLVDGDRGPVDPAAVARLLDEIDLLDQQAETRGTTVQAAGSPDRRPDVVGDHPTP